jgi:multisubunit Na+/H+ antiporter MnhC subunit
LQHLVIVCAVLAGLAEVPWQATALAGATVFALQDLGAYELSPEPRSWRLAIGMALIGAGQALLAWSIGMARLLVGS